MAASLRHRLRVRVRAAPACTRRSSPTPGSTTASAPPISSRVGRETRVGTEVLQRLLGRPQVPDPVVDDRDHTSRSTTCPLVDGTRRRPRRGTASRSARATPLNDASITWWPFLPETLRRCSVTRAPSTKPFQNSSASCGSKVPIHSDDRVDVVDEERPAREVDRDLHERFVERHERVREAAHAGLVAERLAQRVAEHDADVLDRVVQVDLEVALRPRSSGRSRRACRAARACGRRTGCRSRPSVVPDAVDARASTVDRRLLRLALQLGRAQLVRRAHPSTSVSAARNASFSSGRSDRDAEASLDAGPAREVAHEHAARRAAAPTARARRRRPARAGSSRPTGTRARPSISESAANSRPRSSTSAATRVLHLGAELERDRARELGRAPTARTAAATFSSSSITHCGATANPRRTAASDHTFEYVRTTTSGRVSSTSSSALHGANSP